MFVLRPTSPMMLMQALMAIRSQKDGADVVVNFDDLQWFRTEDALAYYDVLRMFYPGTARELNIEIHAKFSVFAEMCIIYAGVPKGKVFVHEACRMTWYDEDEYVWGTESEQEDMVKYYKMLNASLEQVLTDAYDMELEEFRIAQEEGVMWLFEDLEAQFGVKSLKESAFYESVPEKLELNPVPFAGFDGGVRKPEMMGYVNTMDAFRVAGVTEAVNFINSPGGCIRTILDADDARKRFIDSGGEVTTYTAGLAASAGGFFLITAPKGKRYATKNAIIMIHQMRGFGKASALDNVKLMTAQLTERITEGSNLSREEVEKLLSRDTYLTPKEALTYGMIDGIIGLNEG